MLQNTAAKVDDRHFLDFSVTPEGLWDATKACGKVIATVGGASSCVANGVTAPKSNVKNKDVLNKLNSRVKVERKINTPTKIKAKVEDLQDKDKVQDKKISAAPPKAKMEDIEDKSTLPVPTHNEDLLEIAKFDYLFMKLHKLDPNHTFKDPSGQYIHQVYKDDKGVTWKRTFVKGSGNKLIGVVYKKLDRDGVYKYTYYRHVSKTGIEFYEMPYKNLDAAVEGQNPSQHKKVSKEELESSPEVKKVKFKMAFEKIESDLASDVEYHRQYTGLTEIAPNRTSVSHYRFNRDNSLRKNTSPKAVTIIAAPDKSLVVIMKFYNGKVQEVYVDKNKLAIYKNRNDIPKQDISKFQTLLKGAKTTTNNLEVKVQQKLYRENPEVIIKPKQEKALAELRKSGAFEIFEEKGIKAKEIKGPNGLNSTYAFVVKKTKNGKQIITQTITHGKHNLVSTEYNLYKFKKDGDKFRLQDWIIHSQNKNSSTELELDKETENKYKDELRKMHNELLRIRQEYTEW